MKVLGIATSPRIGANSQTLVEHILFGAEEAGAECELVRLCDWYILPCNACDVCHSGGECVIDDDMEEIISKMKEADALVFGSPVYWFRLNAQAYPFIDRFYAYIKDDFTTDFPKGKKFAAALTCGSVGPDVLNPINDYLKRVFSFLGYTDAGFIWQNSCLLPHDILKFEKTLEDAKKLGASLAKG